VEHLAFNATDNYSNHDIVRFLESIGAEFGACQNAYTSCDETVYELVGRSSVCTVYQGPSPLERIWNVLKGIYLKCHSSCVLRILLRNLFQMVPTDDLSLLAKAFRVMGEFATKIRCAPEDLEKERGAVMEEWRMGNDSSGRAAQAHWKCILNVRARSPSRTNSFGVHLLDLRPGGLPCC
jgi:hypothetical protein